MNKNKHVKIAKHIMKMLATICVVVLLFGSCRDNENIDIDRNDEKPAFTMDLAFDGGVETSLNGEEFNPIELDQTEKELRGAGINLKRDPNTRNFKVNLDLSKSSELPVVVAIRLTNGNAKRMFLGKTNMTLLKEKNGTPNRKFRIEQKGVKFFEINSNGTKVNAQQVDIPEVKNATYDVKLFVDANLDDKQTKDGTKYLINYGFDRTNNNAEVKLMDNNGNVSFDDVQGKIPFVSSWSRAFLGRNNKGETGLSNDNSAKSIVLKAEGSMLMFRINNTMDESTLDLQSVRVYSESLTTNIAYVYDEGKGDFSVRPTASIKSSINEQEKYLNGVYSQNQTLTKKTGTRTFFFWAVNIPNEYFVGKHWVQTSIVAKVLETQGDGTRYWFNIPLLKLYNPLTKVLNGRVVKTEINLEDGTPIHPMNLFAHRFVWSPNSGGANPSTSGLKWRGTDNYYMSTYFYYGWIKPYLDPNGWTNDAESNYITFGKYVANAWRNANIRLPFGKINQANPMKFENENDLQDLTWGTPSIRQLSAIFPMGTEQYWIDQTNKESDYAVIPEQVKLEDYQEDTDFYTILKKKQNRTFAIRFLRKFGDKYYMTPYTAAYRYDRKSTWVEDGKYLYNTNNKYSTLEIRMRPLGGTTYQYNDSDTGYYSPKFSEEELKILMDMVLEENRESVLQHDRWWQDSPLKEDDVVREYPALGFWGNGGALYHVGQSLNLQTHNGSISNIFEYSTQNTYKFDWFSTHVDNYAPIVLLAKRKIIHKNN